MSDAKKHGRSAEVGKKPTKEVIELEGTVLPHCIACFCFTRHRLAEAPGVDDEVFGDTAHERQVRVAYEEDIGLQRRDFCDPVRRVRCAVAVERIRWFRMAKIKASILPPKLLLDWKAP